jgi:two-component sensor histidine kinase
MTSAVPERPRHRRILIRTMMLSWALVALTTAFLLGAVLPQQERMLLNGLESTASSVATSVDQVTARAIVSEDYSTVVEHCTRVVKERPNILYVVVTRKDGFSLVHTARGWQQENLRGHWRPPSGTADSGRMARTKLVDEEVFHHSHAFSYTGISWGWIHIGMSLEDYSRDLQALYVRTGLLAGACLLIGLIASLVFARTLSRPIHHLDEVTRRLAAGDLAARAGVDSGDELQSLAESFNQMAENLGENRRHLEASLKEKELLLREVHHRVKNNLQVLSSLLRLQSRQVQAPEDRGLFDESQNRIRSIALLHERLCRSRDLARIDFAAYVEDLVAQVFRAFGVDRARISCTTDIDGVFFGIDTAIPCGLIINELVSNALKHAFSEGAEGRIEVSIRPLEKGEYQLTVADNGEGMPAAANDAGGEGRSLGMRLVSILAEDQLHGSITVKNDSGTAFHVRFREARYEERT